MSGIECLPTAEGWRFSTSIPNLGSRSILGRAADKSMTTELMLRALNMTARTRGRNDHALRSGNAAHFCGLPELLRTAGHEALDERCGAMSQLKREALIGRKRFDSREEAAETVSPWMEICNAVHPHSTIGMQASVNCERQSFRAFRAAVYNPAFANPSRPAASGTSSAAAAQHARLWKCTRSRSDLDEDLHQ